MIPIEEQKEILKLMTEVSKLLDETNTNREKFYSHYKVTTDKDMTLEQLRDAKEKLLKKVGN